MSFNVGDMCYHDFTLCQVKAVKEGHVWKVSGGGLEVTGGNLRCFLPTLSVKVISADYTYWSDRLHKEGLNCLNYPDIHGWMVDHWAETCTNPEDTNWVTQRCYELQEFAKEILDKCEELNAYRLKSGIGLMR